MNKENEFDFVELNKDYIKRRKSIVEEKERKKLLEDTKELEISKELLEDTLKLNIVKDNKDE